MPKADIVFIVGVGRSGTSLLQNMLNAHSNICFLPENSFLRRYFASGKFDDLVKNADTQAFARKLAKDTTFKRLQLSSRKLADLLESDGGRIGDQFFVQVMREYIGDNQLCKFIGDKDPRLIEFLPMLHASFPNARIIHIYRDPRDVALSKTKAPWSRDRSFLANLFAGRVQWTLARQTGIALFGEHFYEIAYEDLISEPQRVLERLCEFMGLEFDLEMLSPETGGQNIVASDEIPWKRKSLGPILSNNAEKWRKELSPTQIALTEAVSRKIMIDQGYTASPASASLSILQKSVILVKLLVVSLAEPVYCRYRIWKQSTLRK